MDLCPFESIRGSAQDVYSPPWKVSQEVFDSPEFPVFLFVFTP